MELSRPSTDFDCSREMTIATGLNIKIDSLYAAITKSDYDIIAMTETWLHSAVVGSELFPDSYQIYRKERQFEAVDIVRGGGVLVETRCY